MGVVDQPDGEQPGLDETELDVDAMREWWLARLDRDLERASFSVEELNDLACRYRISAEMTMSRGVRRAGYLLAERLERAARDRLATGA